jgi:DNA-binding NarL/FixJ family response regulator
LGMELAHASALIIGPPGRWRSSLSVLLQATPEIEAVHQADDPAAALPWIAENRPALILLDGGLPGEACPLALQQIKRTWPQVRVVILVHDSAQAQRAANAEADAVLQVGFSGETLYATVGRLLT